MRRITVVRGRNRHAFTLLEMIVVAAVALIIFAFLLRWVMTLGGVSDDGLSQAAAARGTQAADIALSADTTQVTACSGAQGAIRTLLPRELELYIASPFVDGIEETHLVRYIVNATGQLTRTEFTVDSACAPAASLQGARVVADGISGTAALFTGSAAGQPAGTCTTTAVTGQSDTYESDGTGCHATGLNVSLLIAPQGPDGGHDVLDRSYTLPQSGGTL